MPEADRQRIAEIRTELNVVDRGVHRLWDFFEEENWKRSMHEAEELCTRTTRVRDLISKIKEDAEDGQDNGGGAGADPPHSG